MRFVIILLFLITIIFLGYYKGKKYSESFDTKENHHNQIYFNQSIQYHQMEKVSEIKKNDKEYISFWNRKPNIELGYLPLGSLVIKSENQINGPKDIGFDKYQGIQILVKNAKSPLDFILIWKSQDSPGVPTKPFSIWKIIPPEGYIGMGDIITSGFEKPNKDEYYCLPLEMVEKDNLEFINNDAIYYENGLSIYEIGTMGFFMGTHLKDKPLERKEEIYKIKEASLNNIEIDPLEKNIKLKIVAKS